MSQKSVHVQRRNFFVNFLHGLRVVWPVFSGLLLGIVGMSMFIGWMEGWTIGDSVYFGFVTALTIGYGDFVPTMALTRVLAIILGTFGFIYTGILAAIAVHSLRTAITSRGPEDPI